MTSIETSEEYQQILYWAPGARDVHAEIRYTLNPYSRTVRWEESSKEVLDPEGKPVKAIAVMFASREYAIEGMVALGDPIAGGQTTFPLYKIIAYDKIPDLKGRIFQRTYYLIRRAGGELPSDLNRTVVYSNPIP